MEGLFSRKTVVVLVLLAMYHCAHWGASAATCADVATNIQPCMSTLNGTTNVVTTECCNGLLMVVNMEPQMGAPRTCKCIESMVMNMPQPGVSIHVDVFTNIQNQCNATLGFNLTNPGSC